MANTLYTRLDNTSAAFKNMMKRFGIVTVMNAKIFDVKTLNEQATPGTNSYFEDKTAYEIYAALTSNSPVVEPLCRLDTLKVANVTIEGPSKTVSGGQYANPLIKFGKTARLEMQDALGNAEAIEYLCGGLVEYDVVDTSTKDIVGLHNGSDFAGEKLILGDTFFIDQTTGRQVKVAIIFYQFLPDSIFNLTQDAEGDATVFDMNGDLLTTDIMVGSADGNVSHGVFYSIIDPAFQYSAN